MSPSTPFSPPSFDSISPLEQPTPNAIVFVMADVADYPSLLADLAPGTEVHVLDAGEDGLAQMAQVLHGRSGIDGLHIISHGSEGTVSLGSLQLSSATLPAHADDLATIRAALNPGADILLYGCDVGAGTNGATFVESLAQATGADVAASSDLTGAAAKGGNWELERVTGAIDFASPLSLSSLRNYAGVLANDWEGTGDGTYRFSINPGDPVASDPGFVRYGDKFIITSGVESFGDGIFYNPPGPDSATGKIEIKAEGGTIAKTFTFKDIGFSVAPDEAGNPIFALNALTIITRDINDDPISTHQYVGQYTRPDWWTSFQASQIIPSLAANPDEGVASLTIEWTISNNPGYGTNTPSQMSFGLHDITIADVSAAAPVDNTPPTVESITRATTGSGATNATSVTYTVTFSEAVSGVRSDDFTLSPTGTVTGTVASASSSDGGITWTVTVNGISGDGTLRLDLKGSGTSIVDLAGNLLSGGFNSGSTYTFDHTAPQVSSITLGTPVSGTTNLGTVTYTVSFSEPVTGVSAGDFQLNSNGTATGTIGAPVDSGDGRTYTVTVAGISGDGTLRLDLKNTGTGIVDGAGNAAPGYTAGATYDIDRVAPTVTSVGAPMAGTYRTGQPLEFTVNFSEAVTVDSTNGTPSIGLTLDTGGTVQATYKSGSGTSALVFSYTVVAGNADANGVTLAGSIALNNGTIHDAAGNDIDVTLNNRAPTSDVLVDGLAASVASIERVGDEYTNATTVQYTVTFSDAVTGVDAGDFSLVENGASGQISGIEGDGDTYIVTVTNVSGDGTLRLDLKPNGTGIEDSHGQAIAGGYTSGEVYHFDHTPPALATDITLSRDAFNIGAQATVTFTFSEAVKGFTTGDVTVPNGTLTNLASSDGGFTWTATLTPAADAVDATNVLTLDMTGLTDLTGNAGVGTQQSSNYTVDTVRPHLVGGIAISDDVLKIGDTATVTFVFNEAVTGFDLDNLQAGNGTLTNLSTADNITWTATLSPAAGTTAYGNTITLNYTGIADAAGNGGATPVGSASYVVDTERPALALPIGFSDANLTSGETATVTFTFSEKVTGFTIASVTVPNGTLSELESVDGITWTATLTPKTGVVETSNFLTVDFTTITDVAGNPGVGTQPSGNYTIDTTAPALAKPIEISDTALKIGGEAIVTFTFDGPVSDFTEADVDVPNGVLTQLVSADGGTTWTATLTPNADASDATNVLTLNYAGIRNASGNAGTGSAESANYVVDTVRPTLASDIAISDTNLVRGETATVTFTFTEAVTGFGAADVTVPNGTLSNLKSLDGGITWTATLTPAAGTADATNVLTLDYSGITDLVGNAGAGSVDSGNYAVDTTAPVTPPTNPPTNPPTAGTIDGVTVRTETLPVDPATGLAGKVLTVPIITGTRADDPNTPNGNLADIPLGIGSGTGPRTELLVSLPVGTGMRAEGPSTLLTNQQALLDLIHRIESRTDDGSSAQLGMTGNGTSFLGSLAPDALLQSQTLVLSAAPGLSAPQAILVNGSSTTPADGGQNATAIGLVIDTTGLPAGSTLQLNNVDFAAIVGAVTVRGGEGRNFVTGDDASQNIFLGADDDVLMGGGGNDIIGSAGGNDIIDGGSGDDILVGGIGNDRLVGGTGNNVLQGGRSTQGAWEFYLAADGTLMARHETALFAPGQEERLALAELNESATELAFLGADKAMLSSLSLLYHAAFGRAPDLGGLAYWALGGATIGTTADYFLRSSEWQTASGTAMSDAAFVETVYDNAFGRAPDDAGLAYWTGKLAGANGAPALGRAEVLVAIAHSAEHETAWNTADGFLIGEAAQGLETDWIVDDGIDTAVFAGKTADYKFIVDGDGRLKVEDKASGDLDQLVGIDLGAFSDATLDLGFLQGKQATVKELGLLYQTVLDRAGDLGGFQWWLGRDIDGAQLVKDFIATAEFKGRYDSVSDAAFVQALYDNSGLDASAVGGKASWESYLATHTRAELVASWLTQDSVVDAQFAGAGLWVV